MPARIQSARHDSARRARRSRAAGKSLNRFVVTATLRTVESILAKLVADSCAAMQSLVAQQAAFEKIAVAAVQTLRTGGKVLTCGNGGSAADAMHLAEELVGRYRANRRSLPGLCLNADATVLTCI